MIITKQQAIAQALKLHEESSARIGLVELIQRIYKSNHEIHLDHLCFMMHFLASNLDPELESPVSFYILCLRLGNLENV